MPELFAKSQVMGTFKGFNEKGLEFAAEIIAPYDSSMLERPQLGQFLLIQLESEEEASLGRITKYVPSGLLASAEGEDYVNTMQSRGHCSRRSEKAETEISCRSKNCLALSR